jgi:hypothetical protein
VIQVSARILKRIITLCGLQRFFGEELDIQQDGIIQIVVSFDWIVNLANMLADFDLRNLSGRNFNNNEMNFPLVIDNPVKNHTITNGNYYILYDNCEQELIETFEEHNGSPLLYKNGIGQYDLTNNLVKEFSCKYDCIKE